MNRRSGIGVGALLVALAALGLRAAGPQLPSNTWAPAGEMALGRAGAAATLLADGRVLVTGGQDPTAVSTEVERYDPASDAFLRTPPLREGRAGHSATLLLDGHVLVAGGLAADGAALSSIEIYDPAANLWRAARPLNQARAGHTATRTADNYILFAGGADAGAPTDTLELLDPLSGIVYPIDARLSAARSGHAAALLRDGRIAIIGGTDGVHALASMDIIDPYGGTITAGPALSRPRTGHTATVLLDGRVLVTGGADDATEMASAEIFDPVTNTFAAAGGTLSAARQGHQAILLPHNNAVLVVGGSSGGAAVPSAELFVPWQGPRGQFFPTTAPSVGRVQALGTALSFPADLTIRSGPNDGLILLAGGRAAPAASDPLRTAELYGFATVTTDKADYAPDSTVTISGAGWQPGETVSLAISESGGPHRFGPFLAVADRGGRFQSDEFTTDLHDFELKFYLTATGSVSQAQTSFTDAQNATVTTFSCAPHAASGLPMNVATTCTASVTDTGTPLNGPPTGTVAWNVANGPAKGNFSGSPCTLTAVSADTSTCSVTYTPTNNKNGSFQAIYTSDTTANWANSSSAYAAYTVIAPDGSGTMTMTPTTVTAGTTGTSYTVTFRAASDGTAGYRAGSTATIQIPNGWTAPQNSVAGSPGYVSITGGNCPTRSISAITGTGPWTVTVDIVCGSNDTFVLSYAGGGTAVTAPTAAGTYTFATQTQSEGGPLTDLAASPVVTVNPGPAVKVGFPTTAGGGTAGVAWAAQPVAAVQDTYGNTVPSSSASITLAIGTNPGGGTLSGTATLSAVNGVATFSGLSIDKSGTGYTLTATSAGLTAGTSAAFNITFAAATQVVFTTAPGGGTGGLAWAAQPVLTVQDAFGNTVTNSTASVVLAIGTNPGPGTLGGTATRSAVGGVATFSGLSIDKVGTGYTLTAASTGLTGATSAAFNITLGPAAKIVFTTQPASSTGGTAFPTQPVAKVQDAGGNIVTGSTASVTLAIGTNPGGGTLAGTVTVSAVAGVATFSGVSIDKAGTGYTLTSSSAGLTGGTSGAFNITVGAAVKVAFTTNPGSSTGGVAFATQPVVTVQDAGGNTVTASTASITVAIGSNPGGGVLAGTATLSAVAGVATFSGLSINKAGTGYTLTAASAGLTGGTSAAFNITVGPATRLAFATQPGGGTGGTAWATQPTVVVTDAGGNTVTTSSASITLAIATNPGGGALTCTANPKAAASGVDAFGGCKIDLAGTGYTLSASSGGLTAATSSAFNVTVGAAVKLGFTTSPVSSVAGTSFGAVVAVQDAGGNTVPSGSGLVTLAIGTNPGGGTLSGTAAGLATSGTVTFSGLSIDKAGTGYTLTASSTGLTSGTSGTFNITFAAAAKVGFTTQPGGGTGGTAWATQPVVTVQDAFGNTVTSSTAAITLAIGTNPGAGTLTCTANPKAAASGIAAFAGCRIDFAGTGYTLTAATPGLTGATSSTFNVTAGAASKLAFSSSPGASMAGAAFGTQPVVTVQDQVRQHRHRQFRVDHAGDPEQPRRRHPDVHRQPQGRDLRCQHVLGLQHQQDRRRLHPVGLVHRPHRGDQFVVQHQPGHRHDSGLHDPARRRRRRRGLLDPAGRDQPGCLRQQLHRRPALIPDLDDDDCDRRRRAGRINRDRHRHRGRERRGRLRDARNRHGADQHPAGLGGGRRAHRGDERRLHRRARRDHHHHVERHRELRRRQRHAHRDRDGGECDRQ